MRQAATDFAANALPIVEERDKRRLVDRRAIAESVRMLGRRGMRADEMAAFLVRLFYVDLDELDAVLRKHKG